MSMPGRLLSQPASSTVPSSRSACTTVSTESAMISRLTSEKCIPTWPIEMPSETEIVPNSIGKPPARCTPSLAAWASRCSDRLHGVISFHDDAMPICGLAKSSSRMPTARSIPRAGGPFEAVGDLAGAGLEVGWSGGLRHRGPPGVRVGAQSAVAGARALRRPPSGAEDAHSRDERADSRRQTCRLARNARTRERARTTRCGPSRSPSVPRDRLGSRRAVSRGGRRGGGRRTGRSRGRGGCSPCGP